MTVHLRDLTDENRAAILDLRVSVEQQRFVGPSVQSALDDAAAHPEAAPWFRGVFDGDEPVGFVMLSWNCVPQPPDVLGPWFLWKLLIDQRYQGRGYGAEVVRQVAGLVRAEGAAELLTSFVPGPEGPGGFYERLGFVLTGEVVDGESVAALPLSRQRPRSSARVSPEH
jgi:diamine N-acetyltransferase